MAKSSRSQFTTKVKRSPWKIPHSSAVKQEVASNGGTPAITIEKIEGWLSREWIALRQAFELAWLHRFDNYAAELGTRYLANPPTPKLEEPKPKAEPPAVKVVTSTPAEAPAPIAEAPTPSDNVVRVSRGKWRKGKGDSVGSLADLGKIFSRSA